MIEKDWNEEKTRKEFIDKLLINSKWDPIVKFEEGKEYNRASVEEYPTQKGPADYVLFHNKRPLAAVEGKKVAISPQNVLQQAQRYARWTSNKHFTFREFRLPFIYSTEESLEGFDELSEPEDLASEAAGHLQNALGNLNDLLSELESNEKNSGNR